MHPNRPVRRPASLSLRLTLLFSAATACILLATAGTLYISLHRLLAEQARGALRAKLSAIVEILEKQPGQMDPLTEEMQWEESSGEFARYYSRVLDGAGKTLLETRGMTERLRGAPFPEPGPGPAGRGRPVTWRTEPERTYLLGTARALEGGGGPARRIEVAVDTSDAADLLEDYRRFVAVSLTAGLAISALAGYLAARRGLRPLDAVARKVQRIRAERLSERLGPGPWPAEISGLAAAFDGMLVRLEESFSRLSAFSDDMAHDLRTPITNCMGELEVALSRPRTSEEYRAVLESSLEELGRLSRMIENLLFLARADHAQVALAKAPVDTRSEMEAVAGLYEALAQESGVDLKCSGSCSLRADSGLLRRALGNLLSNAIRHTPSGGRVLLEAWAQADGGTAIAVRDSGPGIPPEDLSRIFDRFYRSPQSRSLHPQGLGLGLAIVRSIMDLHGGTVEILRGPQGGTEAVLHFPP